MHIITVWNLAFIKGIVHSKLNMMSSFTHPSLSIFCWKKNIFWRKLDTSNHVFVVPTMEVSFLQIVFFCVQQKMETHKDLEPFEGE